MANGNGKPKPTNNKKRKTKPPTKSGTDNGKPKKWGGIKKGEKIARDENGLTPKQLESIPIIAKAKTPYRGVLECVELGIISSTAYWYGNWNKQESYSSMWRAVRAEVKGTVIDGVLDRFVHHAEDNADIIQQLAYKAQSEQVRLAAASKALHAVGVDTGGGTRVNVNATASAQISEKQDGFLELLADKLQKRLNILSPEK
jgi:hypothetical protein